MNKLPKDLVNRPIIFRGAVENKIDNKKLIMFANNHILTVHQRGKPEEKLRKDSISYPEFQFQGGFAISELDYSILAMQNILNSDKFIIFSYKFGDITLPAAILGRRYLSL